MSEITHAAVVPGGYQRYNKQELIQEAVEIINSYQPKEMSNLAVAQDILARLEKATGTGGTAPLGVAGWLHQTYMMISMGLQYEDLVQLLMGLKLNDEVTALMESGQKAEA